MNVPDSQFLEEIKKNGYEIKEGSKRYCIIKDEKEVIKVPKMEYNEPLEVMDAYLHNPEVWEDELMATKKINNIPYSPLHFSSQLGLLGVMENLNEWKLSQILKRKNKQLLDLICETKFSADGMWNKQERTNDVQMPKNQEVKSAIESIILGELRLKPQQITLFDHFFEKLDNMGFDEQKEKVVIRDYGSPAMFHFIKKFPYQFLEAFEEITKLEKQFR